MKLDYDFKQYALRLVFLIIILNTIGVFIVLSAISAESFKPGRETDFRFFCGARDVCGDLSL